THGDHRVGSPARHADLDRGLRWAELGGVVQEIEHDLFHPIGIDPGLQLVGHPDDDGSTIARALERVRDAANQASEVDPLAVEAEPAGLDPGDIQQLLHEPPEPRGLLLDTLRDAWDYRRVDAL